MIESASTQGHNMANRDLQQPGSGSLVQTSKFYGPETGTAMLDMQSDRNRAASGTVASVASTACAPLDLSVQDWDILFRAVEERLRRIVGARNAGMAHLPKHDMGGSVREAVGECLGALDQLHAALTHERERANAHSKLVDAHTME